MKPNTIRNKALNACDYQEEARKIWRRVLDDHPGADVYAQRGARLAMLHVIADGGSFEEAEKAAREALS